MGQNFGHLVRRLLIAKNWKLKELAERTGLDKSRLSRYLNGSRGIATPDAAIKSMATALGVNEDLFRIAQGQIPDHLYSTLCIQYPEETLSFLRRLAAKVSIKAEKVIENLARDLLFRYFKIIGREKFIYPIDIRDILKRVYGLDVLEKSFTKLDISDPQDGRLCGILIPENAHIGNGFFNNIILLNSDLLNNYKNGWEVGRFTLAHEAFHREIWEFDHSFNDANQVQDKNVIYCRIRDVEDIDPNKMETKANYFAGALLMPGKDIMKEINEYPSPLDIKLYGNEIRSRYGVSLSALKVRLRILGLSFFERGKSANEHQLNLF
jgi:transcriptional regulator with XRE-family HTH domain